MEKGEKRLNEELCTDDFEICVPIDCRLLGRWDTKKLWLKYLVELAEGEVLPEEFEECPPLCWSCDGRLGWKLTGDWALWHACRVHDKIYRQALGLDQVTAIDVGFAISERQTQFLNFLAIRVHVNQKLPPEQLFRAGLGSLTDPLFSGFFRTSDDLDLGDWADIEGLLRASASGHPCGGLDRPGKVVSPCDPDNWHENPDSERQEQLWRLLARERRKHKGRLKELTGRYPLSGVHRKDLSVYCPESFSKTYSLEDIRLCLCGVPIDIVNAQYNPSITHPGGDADSGVFVKSPRQSVELENDELLLVGRGRVNPMVGGISVGTVTGQAGTLGTIVWDRTDGTACGLSNWHVLAGRPTARVGQPTYQPALFDGGTENDVVGRLKRWHLGEEGDAALTEITGNRHYASGEVLGLWHPITGCLHPKLNMKLRKWGRTTGFTQGFVDGVHLATNIDYGDGVIRNFRNQFHIAPLYLAKDVSQSGDSGSLVVTSFEPLNQHRQLEKLTVWLRQCCESKGYSYICRDALCSLEGWMKGLLEPLLTTGFQSLHEVIDGDSRQFSQFLEETSCSTLVEDCEEKLSKFLHQFHKTVHRFCDVSQHPTTPPETCCCLREPCCEVGLVSGTSSAPCACCKRMGRGFDVSDLQQQETHMRFCPGCFLKTSGRDFDAEHRQKIKVVLRDLKVWEEKIEVLLKKCRNAELQVFQVLDFLHEAVHEQKLKFSWEKPDGFNSVSCCEELEKLYRHIACRRIRVEKCVTLCDEIVEYFDRWRRQSCSVLKTVAEVEKLCDALYCCSKKSRSKDPGWVVRCIEDLLSRPGGVDHIDCQCGCSDKKRQGDTPGFSDYLNQGCGARIIDQLSPRDYLKLEALSYGSLEPEEREKHWFRLMQRKDLELSVGYDPKHPVKDWFTQLLLKNFTSEEIRRALLQQARERLQAQTNQDARDTERAYYAVGMIFAGDTPGSPFGEFAIASDIVRLQETLRFSMRPVFEPRSSFRELRERPQRRRQERGRRPVGGVGGIAPGDQSADPRGGGPQPDVEPLNTGPGDRPSGNSDG